MPRALISVYDKTDLVRFASVLVELGWDLVASGGTENALRENGMAVTPLSQLTRLPEMLDGRVKTLHPAIHAGILARDTQADFDELSQQGFAPINMVICNLYPFQQTVARTDVALEDAIEQIDIGGVTLLRAAAKNFSRVTTICDPSDYNRVTASLKAGGEVDLSLRRDLAVKAFAHTRDYDTAIHGYLAQGPAAESVSSRLPDQLSLALYQIEPLRYGENPHQSAAYFSRKRGDAPLGARQLSYNNILDLDAAWRAIGSCTEPAVVIVKHLTPTGVAVGSTIAEAFPLALASDPVSAFGGVMAVNRVVDDAFVESLGTLFVEAIAAPEYTPTAQATLTEKRKNCRLLQMGQSYDYSGFELHSVHRGFLMQRTDPGDPEGTLFKTVTDRVPTDEEMAALEFAWMVVQHVKSNAIVLARPGFTVGVGGGLPSRVDAVHLAAAKAGERARGAVMASDAFFPFSDGLEVAAQAGITSVIQPGGSIRDKEVIEAANAAGMAMVWMSRRDDFHKPLQLNDQYQQHCGNKIDPDAGRLFGCYGCSTSCRGGWTRLNVCFGLLPTAADARAS